MVYNPTTGENDLNIVGKAIFPTDLAKFPYWMSFSFYEYNPKIYRRTKL